AGARAHDREPALRRGARCARDRVGGGSPARGRPQDSRAGAHAPRRAHRGPARQQRDAMTDAELHQAWTTLEPDGRSRRRIDTQVSAWLDAHDTSLAAEWLGLLRVAPLAGPGLALASAASMSAFIAPALLWLARVIG